MKYNPQINSLIQEIAGLCYQIKCAHGHDVFFSWTPHVGWAEVRFFRGPWARDTNDEPAWSFSLSVEYQSDADDMRALRDRLAMALAGDNRPTGQKEE